MKILLDECVPEALKELLGAPHECYTVQEMGWSGNQNGQLLALAAGKNFKVLLTVDKGIRHQQNLSAHGMAVLILEARSNKTPDLLPLLSAARAALRNLGPGMVQRVPKEKAAGKKKGKKAS